MSHDVLSHFPLLLLLLFSPMGPMKDIKAYCEKEKEYYWMMTPLKLLSEYISMQNIPEDRHIFSIKRCQVHTIVKKYRKMLALISTLIRLGIHLPSI